VLAERAHGLGPLRLLRLLRVLLRVLPLPLLPWLIEVLCLRLLLSVSCVAGLHGGELIEHRRHAWPGRRVQHGDAWDGRPGSSGAGPQRADAGLERAAEEGLRLERAACWGPGLEATAAGARCAGTLGYWRAHRSWAWGRLLARVFILQLDGVAWAP
jgi:hypothetical protein